VVFGENRQAHNLRRVAANTGQLRGLRPVQGKLVDWAYLGYIPDVLETLKEVALPERWKFKNTANDPNQPYPILYGYLVHTFGRLALENKIMINQDNSLAAFNTGLVDRRYESIYALFTPNGSNSRTPWRLDSFCVAGEGREGQDLVRHFKPLPSRAHYFDDPSELFYDVRAGKPELSLEHIIIDNINRFPKAFIEEHRPSGFQLKDTFETYDEYDVYFEGLGKAIKADNRTYRAIMNRLKDALDLSIKRASWNFKTAIPQYYPRERKLTLLLPICLVSDEQVDLALAVEKTEVGNYLGHTILTLDWAYRDARLICRPDSDWLVPDYIVEGSEEQAVQAQTTQPEETRELALEVSPTRTDASEEQVAQELQSNLCPVCGIKMEIQIAPSGKDEGQQFYVCPNVKQCRQYFRVT
jgi:hypothetical protein